MCGRYTLTTEMRIVRQRFGKFEGEVELFEPRYNIAPSQLAPVIVNGTGRHLRLMRWGLVPSWAKESSIGSKMINARAETLLEKPSYKGLMKGKRCLVMADSFYEWRRGGKEKTPFRFLLNSKEPFAFAGLWDEWLQPDGSTLYSYTIITTQANELLETIHGRMPVILKPESEERWLSSQEYAYSLLELFEPYPADAMTSYEVSPLVNFAHNDSPDCIEPADLRLF